MRLQAEVVLPRVDPLEYELEQFAAHFCIDREEPHAGIPEASAF